VAAALQTVRRRLHHTLQAAANDNEPTVLLLRGAPRLRLL
jgi:hypothetical protein